MTNLSDYPSCKFVRTFDIEAISLPIVYNKYGDHDPNGMLYVLKKDSKRIQQKAREHFAMNSPQPYKEVQPLVIRANAGDEIRINFYNKLDRKVSMHVQGLHYDVLTSDGANVGNNPDTTTDDMIQYVWYAKKEGVYLFSDLGDARSGENGTNVHGLFGAVIVEKLQSKWYDPQGRFFVLKEDIERHGTLENYLDKVNCGKIRPEPLVIRANAGDCVEIRMTNLLPEFIEESPFQLKTLTDMIGFHIHLVKFDTIVSDGAHEEQHAFNLNGMSWRKEITDPISPLVAEQTIGISEAFNIRVDEYYASGDYLYYFGGIDDAWLGLWGIIRAHRCRQKHLLPLCNHKKPIPFPTCPPSGAKIRKFEIAAIQTDIAYNRYGDHDPEGMLFVPLEQAEDVKCGKKKPIPLILRVNAGDWVEITLYNLFDKPVQYHDYPSVPLDIWHKPSDRVSLSPQFLKHCPVCSAGVNVGFNKPEQTAAPGECIRYLWHADKEYGTCMLSSFGDLRSHRYHGLFGAIIVEPPAAQYYSNFFCRKENFHEQAVITAPSVKTFREFVLFAHNGIRLLDKDGNVIKTAEQGEENGHGGMDHEDTGEKGFNYRSERFFNRIKRVSIISKVFISKAHGDPATPILESYTGERVIIRYLMPADKPRNISFVLHGHNWLAQPDDPFSRRISVQGAVSVGGVYNIELENGASEYPGDYLYRSGSLKWDVESGMWGIFRVMKKGIGYCCKCACRSIGNWWERKWFEK